MAAVWSKLLQPMPYSCYELGHTWTPSCKLACLEVAYYGFLASLKIYAPLYLITAILRRRKKEYYLKRLIPEIAQSTLFLGTNAFMFIGSFCAWRMIFDFFFALNVFACSVPSCAVAVAIERPGRAVLTCLSQFNFYTSTFVPALTAAYVAIILERKSRRGMLALYMANVATETLFRSLAARGLIKPIKHGEVLLFSISAAIYMYLFRKRGGLSDSTKNVFRFLVGKSESPIEGEGDRRRLLQTENEASIAAAQTSSSPVRKPSQPSLFSMLVHYCPPELREFVAKIQLLPKHQLCGHTDSCIASIVQRSVGSFSLGFCIQAAVKLLGTLPSLFKKPSALVKAIKSKDNIYLGLFLGTYTALFKTMNCLLRWIRDEDSELHGLISGFVAGVSMMWYKSTTIAMYFTFKLVEILYFKGIEKGFLPYVRFADIVIYSISTAMVFHVAVFEPQNLRPAYWRFLLKLTNGRFGDMNRRLLDFYGTKASLLDPNFWPKYDPRYTSLTPDDIIRS